MVNVVVVIVVKNKKMRYFNIFCYLIFMILLNMKIEGYINWSWWLVFVPLLIPIIQIIVMGIMVLIYWINDKLKY